MEIKTEFFEDSQLTDVLLSLNETNKIPNDVDMISTAANVKIADIPTMSRWAKIQQSSEIFAEIQKIYSQGFPIEARHFFADWIECQSWSEIQEGDVSHEAFAHQLLSHLISMLQTKDEDQFYLRVKLKEIAEHLKRTFDKQPMAFVNLVKNCLDMEQVLLQSTVEITEVVAAERTPEEENQYQTEKLIDTITAMSAVTDVDLTKLKQIQETFVVGYTEKLKYDELLKRHRTNQVNNDQSRLLQIQSEKNRIDLQLQGQAEELRKGRQELAVKYFETDRHLKQLQDRIIGTDSQSELNIWKRGQKLAGNDFPFDSDLKALQTRCEKYAQLLMNNRTQMKEINLQKIQLPIDNDIDSTQLSASIDNLLDSLVKATFLVENQPPQNLRKDQKFSASVRLLVGGKLNVHMNPPRVIASIISEEQARKLEQNSTERKVKREPCGEIVNNLATMSYDQTTGHLGNVYKNMVLKGFKRSDRKASDFVTEGKFCILFSSEVTIGEKKLDISVKSLPVVVTSHSNQDKNAVATILWDNAFSEPNRVPFYVPESVPWPMLAEQLDIKFRNAGRGLSQDNIQYLASKIFNDNITEDYTNRKVTWSQFNKDTLPGHSFTFWDWFYAILKLTIAHLKDQWTSGLIVGFVSKNQAQEWLKPTEHGTFLLRFSDSEIGGLTIAWAQRSDVGNNVYNLAPFVTKDLQTLPLPDRVKTLSNLVYLFPNRQKEEAFGPYYTQNPEQSPSGDGYIKPLLVNVINWNNQASLMNTDSPQSHYESQPMSNWSDQLSVGSPVNLDINLDDAQVGEYMNMDYNPDDIRSINMGINVNDFLTLS